MALDPGTWIPISQLCPLKGHCNQPPVIPLCPGFLTMTQSAISSLQRLPGSTGRGLGCNITSAKVENHPLLCSVVLLPGAYGVTPGLQVAWGLSWKGEPWGRVIIKLLVERQQGHCEVSVGLVLGSWLQMPTPFQPAQFSGPRNSWLRLVPHVCCRHLGRFPEGNFHQVSSQDPPGEMCKETPPGAQQLWQKKPAPTMSSVSPLPKRPLQTCPSWGSDVR